MDVRVMTQRRAQHGEALLVGRERPVADPRWVRGASGGQVGYGRGLFTGRVPYAGLARMQSDPRMFPQRGGQSIQQRPNTLRFSDDVDVV